MIGQDNSNRKHPGGAVQGCFAATSHKSLLTSHCLFNRNTQKLKFVATHRKQTTAPLFNRNTQTVFLASPDGSPRRSIPSFQPLTSSFLIATFGNSRCGSTHSKQRTRQISNRNKFAPFGCRAEGPAGLWSSALATPHQLARRSLRVGGPPIAALIADPRSEFGLTRLQSATSRFLIGSKQGGPTVQERRQSAKADPSRRAASGRKSRAGSRQDAGARKAQTKDRQSGDPSVPLRTSWRSQEIRQSDPARRSLGVAAPPITDHHPPPTTHHLPLTHPSNSTAAPA